ncbi:MAG: nitroreductase family deazaflavin-dependent oxidoreductase [Chloroflexi bacterium]|nr:nitroreductase family deazaflavin-dependent oxidoreductase [Chloroflexota bacterium]
MWYNSIIAWLLRSPLHGMLSGSMMLLTYTGRKSGKTFMTPVEYLRVGNALYVISRRERTWWRSLQPANAQGVPVFLRLQGQDVEGNACAMVDEAQVAQELSAYLGARPAYAKFWHIGLDANGQPKLDDLANAAKKLVVVKIELGGEKAKAHA